MKKIILKKRLISLLAGSLIFINAGLPGYDNNGNDIDECQYFGTCPPGYTCQNTPGSFLCISHETGEMTGGGSWGGAYIMHDGPCTFEGVVDGGGFITLYGVTKKTGLMPGSPYNVTYNNAQRGCEYGGIFPCSQYTCKDFWTKATEVNPSN